MRWLRKFFAPDNSLILCYDHLADGDVEEFESQVAEVGQYYEFVKLDTIVENLAKKKRQGMAAIVFAEARKSTFLRALPGLCGRKIPFTLFLSPDVTGLNRLPLAEEVSIMSETYPAIGEARAEKLRRRGWQDPSAAEQELQEWRRTFGPFPVNGLDPTRYFATWGKIIELPPALLSLGIHLSVSPRHPTLIQDAMTFIRQQTRVSVTLGYCQHLVHEDEAAFQQLGLRALVTAREGAVERSTALLQLPRWRFESITQGPAAK